jgi:Protein of unknown function (DUF1549)/Protein of unknown function (DUF1553)
MMVVALVRAARAGLLLGGFLLGLGLAAAAPNEPKTDAKKPGPRVENLTIDPESLVINKHLTQAWQNEKVKPSERCTDHEFIRRASLDIIGRIATLEEIDAFLADVKRLGSSPARTLLIDGLLASDAYKEYWSTLWTHWLMTRTGEKLYREQIKLWLYEQFDKENQSYRDMVVQLITARGKSNENGAVNYILAHLGMAIPPQDRSKFGQFDMVPITARTFRLFLGYQIQCAQCHMHPGNADWKQHHFWMSNIWFRQTVRIGQPAMRNQANQMVQQLALSDDPELNKEAVIPYENRGAVIKVAPLVFFNGARLPKAMNGQPINRREELAKFITGHANFPRAFVNRMWGHFFGRGLGRLAAADDFGEHNEILHEEMLGELSAAVVKANYNPRALIRWICNSEPYQLSAAANKTNDTPEAEALMSRYLLKAMSPEQLLDSLFVATRPEQGGDPAANAKFRADFMNRLVERFGNDEGDEGLYTGTVAATLVLMNSQDINRLITQSRALKQATQFKKGKESLDFLFLAAYNRPATGKEYEQIVRKLPLGSGRVKETDPAGPVQDVFWALLNCGEFYFNH